MVPADVTTTLTTVPVGTLAFQNSRRAPEAESVGLAYISVADTPPMVKELIERPELKFTYTPAMTHLSPAAEPMAMLV